MGQLGSEEVRRTIVRILGESLALTPEEIKPDSRLVADLGMDSLDFLDVLFSLETAFGLPIRDASLNRVLRPDKSEVAQPSEFLESAEIESLGQFLPGLAETAAQQPVRRKELFAFLTVDSLTRVVERKLVDHPEGAL
jgi:acyl carrier protein